MMKDVNGWCVLRAAGGSTLRLATSLNEIGMEAWTPSLVISRRIPRSRVRIDKAVPMLPTFVFARARHLDDLLGLAATAKKVQPAFSVFRYQGRVPVISDAGLEPLRTAEAKALPKEQRRVFSAGDAVKLTEGPFAGMSGVVERAQGEFVLVCFPGFRVPLKISSFLLRPNEAEQTQPSQGTAARAA
ncbi:transcription termination/antitermination protein NusG [Sphingomonas sanxanigenens]|uniref:transcription termination/antitermination protein NusG n=1 Tax=Sphingomonas sanxanigenens TaxID=397260 RepID=UPI00130122BC|nr:hypothetical protein [Sphingomonas sanxanigenens]